MSHIFCLKGKRKGDDLEKDKKSEQARRKIRFFFR